MIALLTLSAAMAADVDWDLSQRWRRTDLYAIPDGQAQLGAAGSMAYRAEYQTTWFQRTRFSANIADKHAVQLALGTEGDFKRLRQLAASYLGPKWMVGYERGSFPQTLELINGEQPGGMGGVYDELLFPQDLEPQRSYSSLRLRYRVPATGVYAYLGLAWTTVKNPRRIRVYGDSTDTPNDLTLIDGAAVSQFIAPSLSIDLTRFVLAKGCADATYCVRFAMEHEWAVGFGMEMPSKDARQRYAAAWRSWHDSPSDRIPTSMGISSDLATSLGILNVFDLGETARLGVELGVSGRQLVLFGSAPEGQPTLVSLNPSSVAGGTSGYLYYGPHIEAYTRF